MAPHRHFKYDIPMLLNAIRDRPVLWDKTLEVYKDKIERKIAWNEICNMLDSNYEQMSAEEKRATCEHITNKWTNIRDTFVKSVKNKTGKHKKRYMLHDRLKFLIKVIPEDEINEDYEENNSFEEPSYIHMQEEDYQAEGTSTSSFKKNKRDSTEEYVPKSKKYRSIKSEDSSQDSDYDRYENGTRNNIDFVEVDSKVESDPRVMNEDEAFFASLLPTVVRYNEEERLEFRIEVLSVMKKIIDKKKWQKDD